MQNEILPCPCCASEIKGGVQLTGYMMMNKQYIQCDACGLKMESKYNIDEILQSELKAITEELINRWNTRKPMERIVEQLENHKNCYEKVIGQVIVDNYDINLERVDLMNHAIDIVRKGGVENAE